MPKKAYLLKEAQSDSLFDFVASRMPELEPAYKLIHSNVQKKFQ